MNLRNGCQLIFHSCPRQVVGKTDSPQESVAEEVELDGVGQGGVGVLLQEDRRVPGVQVLGLLHAEPQPPLPLPPSLLVLGRLLLFRGPVEVVLARDGDELGL